MATVKDFDGTGDHVQSIDPTGVDPSSGWFFGIWALYDTRAVNGNCLLRVGADSSTAVRGFSIYVNGFDNFRFVETAQDSGFVIGGGSTGTFFRLGGIWAGSGWPAWVIDGASSSPGGFISSPLALSAGDAWVYGEATDLEGTSRIDWDGAIGFSFWVNTSSGNMPTAAELDAYIKDPQSLLADFGATGSVDAGACKILWGFCEAGDATDESGTGNTGTTVGTDGTRVVSPTDYPSFDPCGASASNVPGLYNYRRRQRMAI